MYVGYRIYFRGDGEVQTVAVEHYTLYNLYSECCHLLHASIGAACTVRCIRMFLTSWSIGGAGVVPVHVSDTSFVRLRSLAYVSNS